MLDSFISSFTSSPPKAASSSTTSPTRTSFSVPRGSLSLQSLEISSPGASSSKPTYAPLPTDVVRRISEYLLDFGRKRTVARLQRLNKSCYEAVTPLLYADLDINNRSGPLLSLGSSYRFDLDKAAIEAKDSGVYFSKRGTLIRQLDALKWARTLELGALPSGAPADAFLRTVETASTQIFPNLIAVSFLPAATDAFRLFIPDEYDRPRNPPFLEALAKTSNPLHLCIAFRVAPSTNWEEHREATLAGGHQLPSRIRLLQSQGWNRLRTFTVHDIVHQILPAMNGVQNIYHFAPHLLPPSVPEGQASIDTFRIKPRPQWRVGIDAANIPGPAHNLRAWQISNAVKSLFPSGTDPEVQFAGTSWEFINVEGSILCKEARDDDDESGVGYTEVKGLVTAAVANSLPLDLPAREGFPPELVESIMEKITYSDDKSEDDGCYACGRHSHIGALTCPITEVYTTPLIARKIDEMLRMPLMFAAGPRFYLGPPGTFIDAR